MLILDKASDNHYRYYPSFSTLSCFYALLEWDLNSLAANSQLQRGSSIVLSCCGSVAILSLMMVRKKAKNPYDIKKTLLVSSFDINLSFLAAQCVIKF